MGDLDRVAELLGRPPAGHFEVVVRRRDGDPVVIRNAALLDDGTPMPTRWWLVGRPEREAASRLESAGGVRDAERAVDPVALEVAHARYAAERDSGISPSHQRPRPTGGVGGARAGVKCLHAHLAWYLAGGDDPVGAWVAKRLGLDRQSYSLSAEQPAGHNEVTEAQSKTAVAAIDCGSNSTRLLVSDRAGNTLQRLMRITRLGEGVDATGRLDPLAIGRTLKVLAQYRGEMDRLGVARVRITATSAVRDAENRDGFLDAVRFATGAEPELLAGTEEGRLSFIGATAELPGQRGSNDHVYLVADIGGGSTELVVGRRGSRPAAVSMALGCVRVTERFLLHDPPWPEELEVARRDVTEQVAKAERELPGIAKADELIGLAGTVTTLAAMKLGLVRYDRDRIQHAVLTRNEVDGLLATLSSEDHRTRVTHRGLEEARADVIVGGAVILSEIMSRLGFESCMVSESDILDGLVMSQL